MTTREEQRLLESRQRTAHWKRWGPYLSERAWGTVREDYSESGDAWNYFSHDQARSRAYRWGEDGLAGVSDDRQLLCFALALWNGKDPILKERLFGLTSSEGNLGEDVKEDPHWRDYLLFYEYFHGDNGAGLGASHQTGWTGLAARTMHLFETLSAEDLLEGGLKAAFARFEQAGTRDVVSAARGGR